MNVSRLSMLLAVLGLWASIAAAQGAAPIEVSAVVVPEIAIAGDLAEAELIVQNTSGGRVTVQIEGVVTYADGTTDTLSQIRRRGGLTLETEQGLILNLLFLVPADAPEGSATFTVTARVTKISGGAKRSNYSNPIVVSAIANFDVIAP